MFDIYNRFPLPKLLSNIDEYLGWKSGVSSLWKAMTEALEERNVDRCFTIIKTVEELIVPRKVFIPFYTEVAELSLKYSITSVYNYLKESGKYKPNNSLLVDTRAEVLAVLQSKGINSPDDLMYNFYLKIIEENDSDLTHKVSFFNKAVENTQKLIAIMIDRKVESVVNIANTIVSNDVEGFTNFFTYGDQRFKSLACYMAGLSSNSELINKAINYDSDSTAIGMAEVGNRQITIQSNEVVLDEIKKRLLINNNYSLYRGKDRNKVLFYSSPNIIESEIKEEDDVTGCVEAFAIQMEKFNGDNYSVLKKELAPIRKKIKPNIFTIMKKMSENNRYKVYDYTMDLRLFNNKHDRSRDIEKIRIISDFLYGNRSHYAMSLMSRISNIGLKRKDIENVIPNNRVFIVERSLLDFDNFGNLYTYIIMIILIVLFAVVIIRFLIQNKNTINYIFKRE